MVRPTEAARQSDDYADIEDNDFAEFDFEDETDESIKNTEEEEDDFEPVEVEDDEAEVEIEGEDEFSHFEDEDEFENFKGEENTDDPDEFYNEPREKKAEKAAPPPLKQPIKIVNIPAHLRTNWENYYMEIAMIVGIVIYFLNFFTGKTKNQKVASTWFAAHRPLLDQQFSLVGDDGNKDIQEIQEPLVKESENLFSFWSAAASGTYLAIVWSIFSSLSLALLMSVF